jgi:hypothetical protein
MGNESVSSRGDESLTRNYTLSVIIPADPRIFFSKPRAESDHCDFDRCRCVWKNYIAAMRDDQRDPISAGVTRSG